MEKAKQAKGLEEKKYLPPRGKRRSKACRFQGESRGRHKRGADVDKGAKLSGLKDLSFRGARRAHQEVALRGGKEDPQTQPRLWGEGLLFGMFWKAEVVRKRNGN